MWSPVVSGQPHITFKLCTAWPAAPLTRLSSALSRMIRLVRGSYRDAMSMKFVPTTFLVSDNVARRAVEQMVHRCIAAPAPFRFDLLKRQPLGSHKSWCEFRALPES